MVSGRHLKAYLLAIVSISLAVTGRLILVPVIGAQFPFATLFIAVMASASYGGLGPGLFATALGALGAVRFMLPADGRGVGGGVEFWVGLSLYFVVSVGMAVLGAELLRARGRAELLAERASQDRDQLRITLASIGEGVIVTDVRGRIVSMNVAAETLTGWKADEAPGRLFEAVFKTVDQDTRAPLPSRVMEVLHSKAASPLQDAILQARDGRDRWIDNTAAPMRDGDGSVAGVVIVFREIGERRRGEVAQRLLASIVESSQDAIYGKSLDGIITSWNAGAARLYGYEAEEVLGQPSTILTPADRLAEQSAILINMHEVAEHFETVRMRKDGSVIHVSTSISPVRNENGAVVGSSTISRDITLQKRAEEELRKAQEQLREGDRLKDEFLAILAHELRNPLAPLRNALGILKKADGNSAAARDARDMGERQVHHLARLVDDLLDVSRITHGRIELKKELVRLSVAVEHAVQSADSTIRAHHHRLTIDLPPEPVWLMADEVRLAQILANLLNNAAQYTSPGGEISLTAVKNGLAAEICVTDTGLGIAPEALPRVFDMFTQVSPKESRAPTSLGIGLRLVKRLVEMHGGSVEARSAGTGLGSVFTVRLPLHQAPEIRMDQTQPVSVMASARRKILIVDDNADAAESLAVLLSLDGHDTSVASNGPAALEAMEMAPPHVAFLDIGMPGMDGYEVARKVRANPHLGNVKLVALTGWGQDHDRRRAREAGFDHHLTKPVEPSLLNAVILTGR
ncbi:MAG: PAS domain S-box protein [Vicinamibacteria bacterium]